MSESVRRSLSLSSESISAIDKRISSLSAEGVKASQDHSGEMNFSGCATGYCQAWA